ncbi:MAG: hypothetical protein R3B70_19120 [Polyangiaceae bacterium]
MRFLPLLAIPLIAAGCGSRSDVLSQEPGAAGDTGTGGTGGTGGSTGTTATTGTPTTGPAACKALLVQPTFLADLVNKPDRAPDLGLLPDGDAALVALGGYPDELSDVVISPTGAFDAWPPKLAPTTVFAGQAVDYALGPGPDGPVALIQTGAPPGVLFTTALYPALGELIKPALSPGFLLFATGVKGRFLHATSPYVAGFYQVDVASYEPSSLPQSESPTLCTSSPGLGAAVPVEGGFLSVFTAPKVPESQCDGGFDKPPLSALFYRYTIPPGAGSSLEGKSGAVLSFPEPLDGLHLAPADFGAWAAFHTDGSTSRTAAPITVLRVDPAGSPISPGEQLPVSPSGVVFQSFAIAAVGPRLAVAWIDAIDPSAPTLSIQLVEPDGTLGAATSIPTNDAWYKDHLRLLGSPQGDKLLLTWETGDTAALARIDCLD